MPAALPGTDSWDTSCPPTANRVTVALPSNDAAAISTSPPGSAATAWICDPAGMVAAVVHSGAKPGSYLCTDSVAFDDAATMVATNTSPCASTASSPPSASCATVCPAASRRCVVTPSLITDEPSGSAATV